METLSGDRGRWAVSFLTLFKQIKKYFGLYRTNAIGIKICMVQVFMFFDVLKDVVIDARTSKMEKEEKSLLQNCLTDMPMQKRYSFLTGFWLFQYLQESFESGKEVLHPVGHISYKTAKAIF